MVVVNVRLTANYRFSLHLVESSLQRPFIIFKDRRTMETVAGQYLSVVRKESMTSKVLFSASEHPIFPGTCMLRHWIQMLMNLVGTRAKCAN